MKTKSITNIVKIDEQGIVFSDNTTIRFSECVYIFLGKYPESKSKCIAKRNITAKPPYFEFYTNPIHLKVIFDYRGVFAKFKNEKAFLKLQKQILNLGFTTYDLS